MFELPCWGCFKFALVAAGLFAIGKRTDSLALFSFLGLAHSWGHPLWTSVRWFWRISRNKALSGAALDDSITALLKIWTNPPALGSLCWLSIFHWHSKCGEPFPHSRDANFSSAAANHPPFPSPAPCIIMSLVPLSHIMLFFVQGMHGMLLPKKNIPAPGGSEITWNPLLPHQSGGAASYKTSSACIWGLRGSSECVFKFIHPFYELLVRKGHCYIPRLTAGAVPNIFWS